MLHGADLLLCAAASFLLQWRLVLRQGRDGALARAIARLLLEAQGESPQPAGTVDPRGPRANKR